MAEIINPSPTIEVIPKDKLLERAMEMKRAGRRLSQCCASFIAGNYELCYSFADDVTYDYTTLKVVAAPDEEVPSVTEIFPYASFMENEMSELFGAKIRMIKDDYKGRLYRVKKDSPLLTDADRRQIEVYYKEKEEAAKAAEEAAAGDSAEAAGEASSKEKGGASHV